MRRKGRKPTESLEVEPSLPEPQPQPEIKVSLRQAMEGLKEEQKEALELAYFGGLTYQEAALRLSLPLGTLKSRMRTGLKKLRTALEPR